MIKPPPPVFVSQRATIVHYRTKLIYLYTVNLESMNPPQQCFLFVLRHFLVSCSKNHLC